MKEKLVMTCVNFFWYSGVSRYWRETEHPLPIRIFVALLALAAGIEKKGLHSLRHTFATNLVNGVKQPDGSLKSLTPRQVADLLGHSTSEITELYYVKKDTARLNGITNGFEL